LLSRSRAAKMAAAMAMAWVRVSFTDSLRRGRERRGGRGVDYSAVFPRAEAS
jgi:hypothetical protein